MATLAELLAAHGVEDAYVITSVEPMHLETMGPQDDGDGVRVGHFVLLRMHVGHLGTDECGDLDLLLDLVNLPAFLADLGRGAIGSLIGRQLTDTPDEWGPDGPLA